MLAGHRRSRWSPRASLQWGNALGPYRKAAERVRTKTRADRDDSRIATAGDRAQGLPGSVSLRNCVRSPWTTLTRRSQLHNGNAKIGLYLTREKRSGLDLSRTHPWP